MARQKITETQFKSYDDVDNALKEIGGIQRELAMIEAEQNAAIDDIKAGAKEQAAPLAERIKALETAMKEFCDSNRADFLKVKTKELTFGSVGYRLSTKVVIKKVADCVQAMKDLDLWQFIRIKEEPDKEALKDLDDETMATIGAALKVENIFGYVLKQEEIKEAA
ncbi:MAG: host-nuclease inhibitor Gam family protein [Proteobacteria bacterium]|nr:host-nuclease inhibitor Gam family protein [Pseudomonadota bacterium]MCL2306717.1 host-nuclease inhibitor Gam family protein [Pseudomonadota bacterium]